MSEEKKVAIVACAGMEKSFGIVAMRAVFKAVENLRPNKAALIAIPPLIAGVKPYPNLVKTCPVIIVDGCAERCATKTIVKMGGRVKGRIMVIDGIKKYGLTPDSPSDIGSNGEKLANKIAEDVVLLIDKFSEEVSKNE